LGDFFYKVKITTVLVGKKSKVTIKKMADDRKLILDKAPTLNKWKTPFATSHVELVAPSPKNADVNHKNRTSFLLHIFKRNY